MANQQRVECEAVLHDCLDSLVLADGPLTSALAAADLIDAVELAERVEQLARAVHRLQVRVAGAVEAESPAVRRDAPSPEAPFRRGCDLLRTRLRISGREASRRIRAASAVLPRHAMTGESLRPLAPVLSAGIGLTKVGLVGIGSTGDLEPGDDGDGSAHAQLAVAPGPEVADVILRTLEELRAVADGDVVSDVERTLVGYAETFDPDTMRRVARRLVSLLDPDGVEPTDRDASSRQGVKVGATWHGLTHLDIWADAVQTEVLMTVFDTGTNPRGSAPAVVSGDERDDGVAADESGDGRDDGVAADESGDGVAALTLLPFDDGGPATPTDDRTRPQRMLDALVDACQASLRSAHLPAVGGLPPQLLVTVGVGDLQAATQAVRPEPPPPRGAVGLTPPRPQPGGGPCPPSFHDASASDALASHDEPSDGIAVPAPVPATGERTGWGRLPHAGPVPVSLLRRLACDADIIPIVMGGESEILDVGRARRLVPASMRRALIARDGGCLFPGCTIPSTWTEGHHVVPWSHGGATSIDNTALLCSAHHHAVHSGRWVIEADPRWLTAKRERATRGGGPVDPIASALLQGDAIRPFRVTAPWAALGGQTWNAYPVGA